MTAVAVPQQPVPQPRPSRPLSELIRREHRRRNRRLLVLWSLLALVVAGGIGVWAALQPKPLPLAARFRTQAISVGDVIREVHATGHLEAVTTVQVGAEVSGRIATVEVDYNDTVKAGQILARFDRASLEAQVAQINATLQAARATLEQARTDRDQANRTAERAARLFAQKTISDAEREQAASTAAAADQRARAAEAQVAAQTAALALARTNLGHSVIRAPIDGVIVTRNVDPGQTVASVFQTPVLFSVAADLKKMEVVAAVDEADVGEIAAGQRANFTVNAYPGRTFEGVVRMIRNSPVIVQDVVTYGTLVQVENADLALKPGMTASVRIQTGAAHNVLRVSNLALHFTPAGENAGNRPSAFRVQGERIERVSLTPGISDGELTEIVDRDSVLQPGALVLSDYTPEGKKFYGLTH
jgi:HlyD family secretion protein